MIGKNQMRAIAYVQPAFHVNPGFRKRLNLRHQRRWIDHAAHSNDGMLFWTEDSTRNQLQNVLVFSNDDGVACVVAASDTRDVIERSSEVVDDLSFALIPPLRAHHHDRFHSWPFSSQTSVHQGSRTLPSPSL